MSSITLVLMPGLDGTGDLFEKFTSLLPADLAVKIIRYPVDRCLGYSDLLPIVMTELPEDSPFVLVGESFSSPLAVMLAALHPSGLKGLVVCAGFMRNPVGPWLSLAKPLLRPWFFHFSPPRPIVEYFLIGTNAPEELHIATRRTLRRVLPQVLASRVRTVLNCDVREHFRTLTIPVLYLQADRDRMIEDSCAGDFTALKSETILVTVPAPHFVLQREPELSADAILKFVRSL